MSLTYTSLTFEDMTDIRKPKELYFSGIRIQQTWTALFMLEDILNKEKDIRMIIELGTGSGALSIFFGMHMHKRGWVHTVDTNEPCERFFSLSPSFNSILFYKEDIMNPNLITMFKDYYHRERCLVFCDAGEKELRVPQFKAYSEILKTNDLILAHDYNNSIFAKDVEDPSLEPYRQEDFDSLKCWILSRRKK